MFENIIGNKAIKEYLENTIKSNNITHSYMFVGKSGIGKKLFARTYAKNIMCTDSNLTIDDDKQEEGATENYIKCNSCIKFDSNSNPDYYEIQPDGKSIKIEQIRQLQSKIAEKPIISNKKVYVINDAELMSEESQNCLLKTLEEPPEYAVIILIVSNESKMLATIKSRCVIIKFENLSNEELKSYLKDAPEDVINLLEGSLEKSDKIVQKQDEYESLKKIAKTLENGTMLEVLNNSEILYNQKDEIIDLLEYLNIIFFNQRIITPIKTIEEVKRKILLNNNYDMCIDYLLMHIWEDLNGKSCRS